jgi:Arc/MetJ family transcription regulator
MNLYEMTMAASSLYEMLCNNEIDEQTITDTLDAMGVEEKLESYCKVIRQLESDAEALKAEKARIADKQKTVENSVARMKLAVQEFLKAKGVQKENAGIFKVALSTSKSVEIVDPSAIPTEYIKPAKVEFDKAAIRKVLMGDSAVPGAELKINEGVQIK